MEEDVKAFGNTILETLGCWEAFRKLGYPADDLFVLVHDGNVCALEARWGEKRFVMDTGLLTEEELSDFPALWGHAGAWWNEHATPQQQQQAYLACAAVRRSVDFVMALARKEMLRQPGAFPFPRKTT